MNRRFLLLSKDVLRRWLDLWGVSGGESAAMAGLVCLRAEWCDWRPTHPLDIRGLDRKGREAWTKPLVEEWGMADPKCRMRGIRRAEGLRLRDRGWRVSNGHVSGNRTFFRGGSSPIKANQSEKRGGGLEKREWVSRLENSAEGEGQTRRHPRLRSSASLPIAFPSATWERVKGGVDGARGPGRVCRRRARVGGWRGRRHRWRRG